MIALAGAVLPGGLAWVGMATGVCYALGAVGYWRGSQRSALFYGGSLLGVVGHTV